MSAEDIRRMLGQGQGTMSDKLKTHCDPFEVQPAPKVEPEHPVIDWAFITVWLTE